MLLSNLERNHSPEKVKEAETDHAVGMSSSPLAWEFLGRLAFLAVLRSRLGLRLDGSGILCIGNLERRLKMHQVRQAWQP